MDEEFWPIGTERYCQFTIGYCFIGNQSLVGSEILSGKIA
jgi:hypothetical protein